MSVKKQKREKFAKYLSIAGALLIVLAPVLFWFIFTVVYSDCPLIGETTVCSIGVGARASLHASIAAASSFSIGLTLLVIGIKKIYETRMNK